MSNMVGQTKGPTHQALVTQTPQALVKSVPGSARMTFVNDLKTPEEAWKFHVTGQKLGQNSAYATVGCQIQTPAYAARRYTLHLQAT